MPPGFLAVSSQPSSSLSLDEFHAWYEEEHIPIRLNRLPAFLSGARYRAIDADATGPGWLAMYEIDDTRTFGAESYTGLRERRSEREKDVMRRLEVLVRRTGEDLGVWGEQGSARTTGMKVGRPSECVVTHVLHVDGGAESERDGVVKDWADKIASLAGTIDTWVRMHVVKVLDSGKTKMGVAVNLEERESATYFVVHEFTNTELEATKGLRDIVSSHGGPRVEEWRVWELYKVYPSIAQGNLPSS
ncbi:hypothetical protein BDZ97DRAFT_1920776 [Flammula alnicola]|nr:hypothetical protein BDZ97DRAFT_1920776 [Flammula alnicola]